MGNFLIKCLTGDGSDSPPPPPPYRRPHRPQTLGPHGVTEANVGVAALARDLFNFQSTHQVPEGLSQCVVSSKKSQTTWYSKLLEAWTKARPLPNTPEAASALVVQTLKKQHSTGVEAILTYYGLPLTRIPDENVSTSTTLPEGVLFELHTLPVDAKSVTDGDGITVYVDTADPRESAGVPMEVHEAAIKRSRFRAAKEYARADSLHSSINEAGYRMVKGPNGEETLTRKYRIRLRGIDAPEGPMPFGKEAKDELLKLTQGRCLKIHSYGDDQYGRLVGDVYCDGVFVQEQMLKRGLAWHYEAYDQRPQFAKWQEKARAAHRGLWASSNPEKPWVWRRGKSNEGWRERAPIQVY